MIRPNTLRRYQLEPFRAALHACEAHDAGILVIRMSRQAGKNELSSHLEGALMGRHLGAGGTGVKAAPTQDPQAIRSLSRLAGHLGACGWRKPLLTSGGAEVRLGRASWWFGSGEKEANVVGATADLALEFDEAQDFDIEKHDREYSPMAAATAAARIYYGTAWTDFDLLETTRRAALDMEQRDGQRRVYDVTWSRVAEEVEAYGRFVESERARLGHTELTPHPDFLTQYELICRPGQGRLFTPAQLALLQGDHESLTAPRSETHNAYVAGLDVGGADMSGRGDPDETVLTIAQARYPGRGRVTEPTVRAVHQYAWRGEAHDSIRVEVPRLLDFWRIAHTTVDATGIGEPLAQSLLQRYGERRVTALKVTRVTKSSLAYDLIAGVNTHRLTIWKPDGEPHAILWKQLRLARSEAKPGGLLDFFVDAKEGHDDRLFSLALAFRSAGRHQPRRATQREF